MVVAAIDTEGALMGALRSSPPSAVEAPQQRPRTLPLALRAGGVPKTLKPFRAEPRRRGAADLAEACAASGMSLESVAHAFGLEVDREGVEIKSGKIPITWGEFCDLTPLPVFVRALALAIPRRIARDRSAGLDTTALELVRFHVEALRSLLR